MNMDQMILTLVTFFPLVGALLLLFLREENKQAIKLITVGTTVVTFRLVASFVVLL